MQNLGSTPPLQLQNVPCMIEAPEPGRHFSFIHSCTQRQAGKSQKRKKLGIILAALTGKETTQASAAKSHVCRSTEAPTTTPCNSSRSLLDDVIENTANDKAKFDSKISSV